MEKSKKYNIWMRNYPQPDINVSEEWNWPIFSKLEHANIFIAGAEKGYNDEGWSGHRMYKAKFYAEEER